RRHTRFSRDWSSDVCSSDLLLWGRLVGRLVIAGEVDSGAIFGPREVEVFQFAGSFNDDPIGKYSAKCGISGQCITYQKGLGFAFVILDQGAAGEISVCRQY